MSTLALMLQISLVATSSNNYDAAYKNTNETGRPLVVLVGADWCPGCRTMKQSVIPQLEKNGKLQQVAFATVNTDLQGPLAESLMKGGSIPQLIMYVKTDKGWDRKQMIGAHSPSEVEAFIKQGVAQTAQQQTMKPVSTVPVTKMPAIKSSVSTAPKSAANSQSASQFPSATQSATVVPTADKAASESYNLQSSASADLNNSASNLATIGR